MYSVINEKSQYKANYEIGVLNHSLADYFHQSEEFTKALILSEEMDIVFEDEFSNDSHLGSVPK